MTLRSTPAAAFAVFGTSCASCHGGAKWTKSQTIYLNDPTFPTQPAAGVLPFDPGVGNVAAQIKSYKLENEVLQFLEPVGTFDAASKLEIRGDGTTALGALGFNVPSLLGIGHSAPYFHDGSARTLDDVFARHRIGGDTIARTIPDADRAALREFLLSIDGTTSTFESDTDRFLDALTP
jgi:cytochrome c peroxidase